MQTDTPPIRLGISRCLLGEGVRYDGGHKRDTFLVDVLGPHVEWVPVCPEAEAGLGTPREAMRLEGTSDRCRLITIQTRVDHTERLTNWGHVRLHELAAQDLSGYVFKKDSPSCGVERVRIFNTHGMPAKKGAGLFARAFQSRFPMIPVEEEGRLCDPVLRDNFIERVFAYHRWLTAVQAGLTRTRIVRFHTMHKYLLLAHSEPHYRTLGRLVAQADRWSPRELGFRYGRLFMDALGKRATIRKHVNVLQHLVGHFRAHLSTNQTRELHEVIADYHRGLLPLIVPMTLVRHYVRLFDVPYVRDQVYLNPHPKELMLRNHV
ncbi:hypothetical protein YTPLAS18_01130 [Nitrospira sp.]|nr:hypothetical protein YTPLAS18_01130 [Nitrospira sp.]